MIPRKQKPEHWRNKTSIGSDEATDVGERAGRQGGGAKGFGKAIRRTREGEKNKQRETGKKGKTGKRGGLRKNS